MLSLGRFVQQLINTAPGPGVQVEASLLSRANTPFDISQRSVQNAESAQNDFTSSPRVIEFAAGNSPLLACWWCDSSTYGVEYNFGLRQRTRRCVSCVSLISFAFCSPQ